MNTSGQDEAGEVTIQLHMYNTVCRDDDDAGKKKE